MKQTFLTTVLLSVLIIKSFAQTVDSIHVEIPILSEKSTEPTIDCNLPKEKNTFSNSPYSKFIIPTTLFSYGLVAREVRFLSDLDRNTNNEVKERLSKKIPYDDYTQYAPAVAVLGLDFVGVKAKHNLRDRAMVMATSYLILGATVQSMKRVFLIKRPDDSNFHSFPSGHTGTAFVGAHMLFKEYKDVSPWIGIGGYTVASATGAMRVLNRKHWISDVVAGAGIGILSVELGYMLLPVWHNLFGIKDKSLVIAPTVNSESKGVAFTYTF